MISLVGKCYCIYCIFVQNEEKTQKKDNFIENVKTMLRNDFLNVKNEEKTQEKDNFLENVKKK